MIGTVIGNRYELIAQPSDGPIFTAFLARDAAAGKEVSIRLFRSPFDQELDFIEAVGIAARKAAAVSHPGIERIDGLEYDGGRPFLVGQPSPGITLSERMRKLAPFSVPVAVGTALSILEGLEALHSAGLVHGDVSAENVIIGPDGSARLQLAVIWEAYSRSATAGAVVLPSLAPFLAPEVSAGGVPSPYSDVYSVGILLFELLCGRPPYAADTPIAMAMKHATAPTPSIKGFNASVPVVLDEIVKKAMSKDPGLRYRNAGAMFADLRTLQDALRFGRTLTWPLKAVDASVAAEAVAVAPKMSAARPAKESVSRNKAKADGFDDDLPPWLRYLAISLVCLLGGAFLTYIFVNASKPRMVTLPKLTGKDVAEARSILRGMKLDLREGAHEQNETVPADTVLSSQPEAGDKVREGSTVTVTLSGGSEMVEVPKVIGMEVDLAVSAMQKVNLNVREPVERVDSTAERDVVVDQDPPADRKVDRNAEIRLKVSNGVAPPEGSVKTSPAEPPVASSDSASEYTLHIKLKDTDTPVQVRIEIEDSRGTRTVFEESKDPNDSFAVTATGYGPSATFRIYYNEELKKTIQESANGKALEKKPTQTTDAGGDTTP